MLSENEIQLYKKQINLAKIGIEGQIKIKKTKVLVVGAGGLGCPLLIYLVASGIGKIGILDDDTVQTSNLNRQILYRSNNVNTYKVIAARESLKNINKECNISIHKYKLNTDNRIEIISYYDIILDATDNFTTRNIIDKTCYELNKIYIYGAVNDFDGQISIFNYQNGIRYTNIYSLSSNNHDNVCNRIGIMGITTGYIGILQAVETLKIALGLDKKSQDYLHIHKIDNRFTKSKYIKLIRNIVKKIPKEKKTKNAYQQKESLVEKYSLTINIKNKEESTKKYRNKSINIPLFKLKLYKTIKLLEKYKRYYNFKLYCPNNSRNLLASKILEKNAIEHQII